MTGGKTISNVVVVGCGSMGARRAAAVRQLIPGVVIDAIDVNAAAASKVGRATTVEEVTARPVLPDAAFICTPAAHHVGDALRLVRAGVRALFIEKPLSNDLALTETLVEECASRGVLTMMGQTLRWYSDLQDMYSYIRDGAVGYVLQVRAEFGFRLGLWEHPDPIGAYRDGVLLDAATHEIDLGLWLCGGEPDWVWANLVQSGVNGDLEDIADLVIGTQTGIPVIIHSDLVDMTYRRSVTVMGTDRTATWTWRRDPQAYVRETGAFIGSVRVGEPVAADWPDIARGRRILEVVKGATISNGQHRAVKV